MQQELRPVFSVSELNEYVGLLLSGDPNLHHLTVQGEISGFKRHTSGHLYFSLKDEKALVRCVMFRQYAQQLAFRPQDGQQVVIEGAAALYARDGSFQVYAYDMRELGAGALYEKFLRLKEQLEREGLFDPAHKRPIPFLPRCVGVVTSGSGAALQDILNIIGRRFPNMPVTLCAARVQGAGAAEEIAAAIRALNREDKAEVLIVGRGGGSMEDLWAFNEPAVARAIYESAIPVISAVGHETDFTIADFTADLRAPTPSAAAELAVPEYASCAATLEELKDRLSGVLASDLRHRRDRLHVLLAARGFAQAENRLLTERQRADDALERMDALCREQLTGLRHKLERLRTGLDALSPTGVLRRGFALTRNADGGIVTGVAMLHTGEQVLLQFADGTAGAEIGAIERKENGHGKADV